MKMAIWVNGEPPHIETVRDLMQDVQTLIVADGGSQQATAAGYEPDFWIGDADSGSPSVTLQDNHVMILEKEKDITDTEAAVKLALSLGASEVLLIGGGGMRMDHWLANLQLVRQVAQITCWITRFEVAERVLGPSKIHLGPGLVSIFPLDGGIGRISSVGLKWPLDKLSWKMNFSLSNWVAQSGADLDIESGVFLIIRALQNATSDAHDSDQRSLLTKS